jgi:hypothetical protein
LSDGSNLFDSILVGSQVALESFVLLFESLQFRQAARAEILSNLFLKIIAMNIGIGNHNILMGNYT